MTLNYKDAFSKYFLYEKDYKWRSKRTLANYDCILNRFHQFLLYTKKKTLIYVHEIELDDIHSFIQHNKNRKNIKSTRYNNKIQQNTLYIYVCCLRSFFRYLGMIKVECIHWETIETIKKEDSKIQKITDEELEALIDLTYKEPHKMIGTRNRIILYLAYYSWLRSEELLSLRFYDIPVNWWAINIIGKGSKARTIWIKKEVAQLIYEFKEERKKISNKLLNTWEDYILTTLATQLDPDQRLWSGWIRYLFQKYRKKIGTEKQITCHSLRHKFSMDLYEKWTDLSVIQKLLWHADIKTTQIYATISKDILQKACLSL